MEVRVDTHDHIGVRITNLAGRAVDKINNTNWQSVGGSDAGGVKRNTGVDVGTGVTSNRLDQSRIAAQSRLREGIISLDLEQRIRVIHDIALDVRGSVAKV